MSRSQESDSDPDMGSAKDPAGDVDGAVPEFLNGQPESPSDNGPSSPPPASTSRVSTKTCQPKKASLNSIAFPLARVKRLIKSEGDTRVSLEATYAIAKAVGLFLEKFVEQSFEHMIDDKRHSLSYKDLSMHVSQAKRFEFLADFVPEKVAASSALAGRAQEEA